MFNVYLYREKESKLNYWGGGGGKWQKLTYLCWCKDSIISDLTTRWNSWTRNLWRGGGGIKGVGLMSVECGREKHFDKGLIKKVNGVRECQQTERDSQESLGIELCCWAFLWILTPSCPVGSFLYASLANLAMKGRNASVNWANFSFSQHTCILHHWFTC